ncbi:MAG: 4Fe-4S binding protein [Candidatus Margulisbacteria bacterium]|nr:4Fe-4S binding protein [Candidatus Margulisiibacteriota bacterium]MBU1617388.1 4Fe-4S binding protein [Candidatus Margulisiibacteriota bacterium]
MGKRIYLNLDLCCGCRSCAAACAYGHHLHSLLGHAGPSGEANVPLHCLHCDQPACAAACPNEAMKKSEDGLVLRSQVKCVGCHSCQLACPFGVIQPDLFKHIAPKCDLCFDRLTEGEIPRCVASCTSGALTYEEVDEQISDVKKNLGSTRILSNNLGRRR